MNIKQDKLKEIIKHVIRESLKEAGLTSETEDKWIQKAVDPSHKGYCTPMTKSTCTPRRKALAKRFKKGLDETAYKTQGPSAKTSDDSPQFPAAVNNPKNA